MSEIFDWANMPPVEPLAEPQVKSKLLSKLDDVALIGSLAILGISAYGFFNQPHDTPKLACPELPDADRIEQVAKQMANAPTSAAAFWEGAKAKGLRFAPYHESKALAQTIEASPTAERATRLVNYYTNSNFDFTTSLDKETNIPEEKLDKYKEDLAWFVEDSSLLPIQLVKDNVSSLYISEGMSEELSKFKHFHVAGFFDDETRMISTRPYKLSSTFNHELGHAADERTCSSDDDPTYTKQNPSGFHYDERRYNKKESSVAVEGYGETAPAEDKATLFEEFLDYSGPLTSETISLNGLLFGPKSERNNILLAKLTIFMERIDRLVPGSASYLSSLSKLRHGEWGPDQEMSQNGKQLDLYIKD